MGGKQILIFGVGLRGGGTSNATALRKAEVGLCPGSDEPRGGAHGVLCTEVDVVLLLPVNPVGPWALPGNAEHHHTDDDHLECSNDGGDEDVVQFAGAWNHVEHVVLFDVTLGASETRVTAAGGLSRDTWELTLPVDAVVFVVIWTGDVQAAGQLVPRILFFLICVGPCEVSVSAFDVALAVAQVLDLDAFLLLAGRLLHLAGVVIGTTV